MWWKRCDNQNPSTNNVNNLILYTLNKQVFYLMTNILLFLIECWFVVWMIRFMLVCGLDDTFCLLNNKRVIFFYGKCLSFVKLCFGFACEILGYMWAEMVTVTFSMCFIVLYCLEIRNGMHEIAVTEHRIVCFIMSIIRPKKKIFLLKGLLP